MPRGSGAEVQRCRGAAVQQQESALLDMNFKERVDPIRIVRCGVYFVRPKVTNALELLTHRLSLRIGATVAVLKAVDASKHARRDHLAWYGMAMGFGGVVWYGVVWYGMVWYGMVWLWGSVVWYGMAWYGMALHGMARNGIV